jgi:hypothetical protein
MNLTERLIHRLRRRTSRFIPPSIFLLGPAAGGTLSSSAAKICVQHAIPPESALGTLRCHVNGREGEIIIASGFFLTTDLRLEFSDVSEIRGPRKSGSSETGILYTPDRLLRFVSKHGEIPLSVELRTDDLILTLQGELMDLIARTRRFSKYHGSD